MSQSTTRSRISVRPMCGFTLIEMITVLTIIILVLAIAIPVWNALMGGTNVASAQNQISAFLANARADAIYNRKTIGVCFFIDPKTQRTAMAEVQVQTLYQTPYSGGPLTYTSLYKPNVFGNVDAGPTNSIEMVNSPDTTSAGNFAFYRDVALLPVGVAVALNNNTYTYNQATGPNGTLYMAYGHPNRMPPLDRYLRLGTIMFGPDGTLVNIPFAIPFFDVFTASTPTTPHAPDNLLCQRVGMVYSSSGPLFDVASNVPLTLGKTFPLISSVGLVIFDHEAYLTQHANLKINGFATPIGNGEPFTDIDMNYYIYTNPANPTVQSPTPDSDLKFAEENWIDQNGIALMISPSNGSLIRAK